MENILEVTHLTKHFGSLVAVDDVSFSVAPGEVLGLVGQNGAGKSTTFKMILKFLRPDAGTILTAGQPITTKFFDQLGYLPEERGLYLDMTIQEQVEYFAHLHGCKPAVTARRLPEWLKRLAVKGDAKTKVKDLSKGNQQKVQLITALIHQPRLVILDEPFSGLDPVNVQLLIKVVLELKEQGTAIIFSSHNMKNVTAVSDKLLMLVNGRRRLYGSIAAIRNRYERKELYLEGVNGSDYPGVIARRNDGLGEILTFDSQEHAQAAIAVVRNDERLQGFRLLEPTLDDIFAWEVKADE
ncbi:na abc transporter atpase component [Ligilactobacillus saerimneri DSM 16049]|nr:ATP-binding cassette domain-containing protein [Ligilactobacillus saerimneri]KRL72554.1 na abc transporter atpase component [Ligilactobacillus saerimneri DSM 16049]